MGQIVAPKQDRRLSEEAWLDAALEAVSKDGGAKLRIDRLCAELGVTKGSFYWHFEGREDFLRKLVEHWDQKLTRKTLARVARHPGDAGEKLLALLQMIVEEDLDRYEIAFRAWAQLEPVVAEGVRRVDEERFRFIGEVFEALGFRGREKDLRVRILLSYAVVQEGILVPQTRRQKLQRFQALHAMLTRPA